MLPLTRSCVISNPWSQEPQGSMPCAHRQSGRQCLLDTCYRATCQLLGTSLLRSMQYIFFIAVCNRHKHQIPHIAMAVITFAPHLFCWHLTGGLPCSVRSLPAVHSVHCIAVLTPLRLSSSIRHNAHPLLGGCQQLRRLKPYHSPCWPLLSLGVRTGEHCAGYQAATWHRQR